MNDLIKVEIILWIFNISIFCWLAYEIGKIKSKLKQKNANKIK